MRPASITKHPLAEITYEFDCSDSVRAGDSIASAEFTVYDESGADVSATMVPDAATVSGSTVTQRFRGGTSGKYYNAILLLTMGSGDVVPDELRLEVSGGGAAELPAAVAIPTPQDVLDNLWRVYNKLASSANEEWDVEGQRARQKKLDEVWTQIEKLTAQINRSSGLAPAGSRVNNARVVRPWEDG